MKIENYELATPLINELKDIEKKIDDLNKSRKEYCVVEFKHSSNNCNQWRDDYCSYNNELNELIRILMLNHLTEKANILKSKIEEL